MPCLTKVASVFFAAPALKTHLFSFEKVMRNNNESRADKWCLLTKNMQKKTFAGDSMFQMKGRLSLQYMGL